jgi:hypothetical protein
MEVQSHTALDHLIRRFRQLSNGIAQLPPNSKEELNNVVVDIMSREQFDSEVFIQIIKRDPFADWAAPVGGQYPVTSSSRTEWRQAPADNRSVGSHAGYHASEGGAHNAS